MIVFGLVLTRMTVILIKRLDKGEEDKREENVSGVQDYKKPDDKIQVYSVLNLNVSMININPERKYWLHRLLGHGRLTFIGWDL